MIKNFFYNITQAIQKAIKPIERNNPCNLAEYSPFFMGLEIKNIQIPDNNIIIEE